MGYYGFYIKQSIYYFPKKMIQKKNILRVIFLEGQIAYKPGSVIEEVIYLDLSSRLNSSG